MLAAKISHLGILRTLLDAGALVNKANKIGDTAFLEATHWAHPQIACELLKYSPDLSAKRQDGTSALHSVALRGFIDLVTELLNRKADANAKDNSGNTALHLAAMGGYTNVVQALLSARAEINAINRFSQSALYNAVFHGHKETAVVLLKAGAFYTQTANPMDQTIASWALEVMPLRNELNGTTDDEEAVGPEQY